MPGATGAQDGFVYSVAPVITPQLVGAVDKRYDSSAAAHLVAANDDASAGAIDGDVVTLTNPAAGTYDSKNVGIDKLVSVNGQGVASVTNGSTTVYGHTMDRSAVSSTIGTVSKAQLNLVGLVALDKVDDGSRHAVLSTSAATADGVLGSNVITLVQATGVFDDKNVGNNKTVTATAVELAGPDRDNYTLVAVSGLNANITPYRLTVTVQGQDKVHDASRSAMAFLAGDVFGLDLVGVKSTASFLDKNAASSKFVSVTDISLTGADAGNYSVATAGTFASITPATLAVSALARSKVYDGTTSAQVTLNAAPLGQDQLSVNFTSAAFTDKNTAAGKRVMVNGVSWSGVDAGNYLSNTAATTHADIGRATLNVTASAQDKIHDGSSLASVNLSNNHCGADQVVLGYGSANFDNPLVGQDKTVQVTGLVISGGADQGNYRLADTSATGVANVLGSVSLLVPPTTTSVLPVTPVQTTPVVPLDLTLPVAWAPTLSLPGGGGQAGGGIGGVAGVAASPIAEAVAATPAPGTSSATTGVAQGGAVGGDPAVLAGAVSTPAGDGGASLSVTLVTEPSGQRSGVISVAVPKDVVSAGERFGFKLSAEIANSSQGAVKVSLPNGRPLPEWLRYQPDTKSFVASSVSAKRLPINVMVTVGNRRWTVTIAETAAR